MTEQHQAEYGPVSEDDICNVNYFKTTGTNCNTVKFDFPKEEYCCKPCRDGQENPYPEHRNSCSNIADQTTTGQTEIYTTTQQTFTTASEIQIPATDGTTATNQTDGPTTTAVPFLEEITTEQANTMRGEIGISLVPDTKLDDTTIAWNVVSAIICVILAILAVYFFCKYRKYKKIVKDKKKVSSPTSAANARNGDQLLHPNQDTALRDDVPKQNVLQDVESTGETASLISPATSGYTEANDSMTETLAPNLQQAETQFKKKNCPEFPTFYGP
uniref:uncharacterized protein LOC120328590 n=1 Tax=Styela clava TaxID=7725 RepID=UPI00193AA926|nr:uncharacterized protein LOC120328590 [Styela clava]